MSEDRKLTAYCGLYCQDCIPINRSFFKVVKEFERSLSDLNFDKYAEVKSKVNEVFNEYPRFVGMLEEIKELECQAPCREGGGNPDCKVRKCVKFKGYEGCWECGEFRSCNLLLPLKAAHGETINHNLEMIKKHGPDSWSDKRGKHYNWS
ncbi:MAG: DUF3795 domain-containing protein [Firmicutes bacterium]|nr:DUF3795 domain-containing protein [Bacillota bacterium]